MSQGLRNQYLQTLGIVQYVPKDLPLASERDEVSQIQDRDTGQPNLDAGSAKTDTAPLAVTQASHEVQKASMAELVNLGLQDKLPDISKPEAISEKPDVTAASQVATSIELKFALWQPSDELLVCSSVEDSLPDPEQILLLGNILAAMGQSSGPLPQMELIEWPPYANMAGDETEVREFLTTLVQARVDSKSAKYVLLMGDAAADWLLSKDQQAAVANGQVEVFGQVIGLLVPSLSSMIEQPARKRDAWQTIRFLSPQRQVHKVDS
ncbi:MAG: hypothetical protein HOJ99_06355 [Porticoccaceae bacterium]|nr:hypothetical protein [Porticoccaceae bacterium]MBT5578099.1 hypothetical protein [Porticoccaceae bacterium]